jgi:hypothetical protein
MYHVTKLSIFIRTIVLLTGLLATTGAVAESLFFNGQCGTECHGVENIGGVSIEGVPIPPVKDISFVGILNAINTVPQHVTQRVTRAIPGTEADNPLSDKALAVIAGELAALNPCAPPQTLVNGVCTTPAPSCTAPQVLVNGVCTTPATSCTAPQVLVNGVCTTPEPSCTLPQTLVNGVCTTPAPSCTLPQTLVNGVCTTPAPPACDDSANTALCVNQAHQLGSLGSATAATAKADVYKVTCPKPAVAISANISGLTAEIPAKLSIQLSKGKAVSRAITDKANGDGIASKSARLAKGSGVYKVKINKTKAGVPGIVQYDATISCLAKNKAQVGANIVIKTNQ